MIKLPVHDLNQQISAHYDQLDEFYRKIWGEHLHHGYWKTGRESPQEAATQLSHLVIKNLKVKPDDSICDVGCGYGGTSRILAADYKAHVLGLTISEKQFQYAMNKPTYHGRIRYERQDFFAFQQPDASLDGIIAIEVLSHLSDKAAFFREAHRRLKKGGRLAMTAWTSSENPSSWQKKRLLLPICREGRLPSLYSRQELSQLLKDTGFEIVNETDLSQQVKKTWLICFQRLMKGLMTQKSYWQYLLNSQSSDKVFLLTIMRMIAAYRVGALTYCLFAVEKK